jgi:hypothetical protein
MYTGQGGQGKGVGGKQQVSDQKLEGGNKVRRCMLSMSTPCRQRLELTTKRLQLMYDGLLLSFAINLNLRRYNKALAVSSESGRPVRVIRKGQEKNQYIYEGEYKVQDYERVRSGAKVGRCRLSPG